MIFANGGNYDNSTKPKDIHWISEDIEVKNAPYKPNHMLISNKEIDTSVTEAAFMATFASKPGETFVWVNQYQVKQAARTVASWYGFALSSSAQTNFCSYGKPNIPNPKKGLFQMINFHDS